MVSAILLTSPLHTEFVGDGWIAFPPGPPPAIASYLRLQPSRKRGAGTPTQGGGNRPSHSHNRTILPHNPRWRITTAGATLENRPLRFGGLLIRGQLIWCCQPLKKMTMLTAKRMRSCCLKTSQLQRQSSPCPLELLAPTSDHRIFNLMMGVNL
jgi:hypothetical protein